MLVHCTQYTIWGLLSTITAARAQLLTYNTDHELPSGRYNDSVFLNNLMEFVNARESYIVNDSRYKNDIKNDTIRETEAAGSELFVGVNEEPKKSMGNDSESNATATVESMLFKKKKEPVDTGKNFHVGTGLFLDVNLKKSDFEEDNEDCDKGFWFWPFSINETIAGSEAHDRYMIDSSVLMARMDNLTPNLSTTEGQVTFHNHNKPVNDTESANSSISIPYTFSELTDDCSGASSLHKTSMILLFSIFALIMGFA